MPRYVIRTPHGYVVDNYLGSLQYTSKKFLAKKFLTRKSAGITALHRWDLTNYKIEEYYDTRSEYDQ